MASKRSPSRTESRLSCVSIFSSCINSPALWFAVQSKHVHQNLYLVRSSKGSVMFTRNGSSEVSNIKRRGAVKVKRPANHSDMSRGDIDLRDDPQTEDSINQGSNSDMDVQEEESGPESDEETFEISEDDEETRAHLELAEKIVKANSERKPSLVYKQVTHLIEDGDGNVTADSENNCVSEREVTYILEDHSGCAVANVIDSDDDEQALKEAGLQPPRRRDLNDSDDSAVTDEELMSVQSEDVASHSRSRNASRKMQKIPIIVRHEDSDSDTEDLLRPMNATKPRIVSLLVPDDDESLLTDREDVEVSEDESVPCREPEEVEAKQSEPEKVIVSCEEVEETVVSKDCEED